MSLDTLVVTPIVVTDEKHHRCSACTLRELCLPLGLSRDDMSLIEKRVSQSRRVRRGEALYLAGTKFEALFAVRRGSFKASIVAVEGQEQITGFFMGGDLLGIDGIHLDSHTCNVFALEDSEVCLFPFAAMETLSSDVPALQHHFHRLMSREIQQTHDMMLLLGKLNAMERLAVFLLSLSLRHSLRGYAVASFNLRMTRAEMGSYLGLKLETVSRSLTRLQADGIIVVKGRLLEIVNMPALKSLSGYCE